MPRSRTGCGLCWPGAEAETADYSTYPAAQLIPAALGCLSPSGQRQLPVLQHELNEYRRQNINVLLATG